MSVGLPAGLPLQLGTYWGWHEVYDDLDLRDGALVARPGWTPPPAEVWRRAHRLTRLVLDPLRHAVGQPLHATDWHRTPRDNASIGGGDPTLAAAQGSRHLWAEAVDLSGWRTPGWTAEQLAALVVVLGLPTDQVIWYDLQRGGHLHLGLWDGRRGGERGEVLRGLADTTREVPQLPGPAAMAYARAHVDRSRLVG